MRSNLRRWLAEPVQQGVLSPPEAQLIFGHWQATPLGQVGPLPNSLWDAASRLHLWELEASPTQH